MGMMVRIGMPVEGRTRRFTRINPLLYLYGCPACTGLVSNYQEWCVCGHDLRVVASLVEREEAE